jgi:hypothetical protein
MAVHRSRIAPCFHRRTRFVSTRTDPMRFSTAGELGAIASVRSLGKAIAVPR